LWERCFEEGDGLEAGELGRVDLGVSELGQNVLEEAHLAGDGGEFGGQRWVIAIIKKKIDYQLHYQLLLY